MIRIRCLEGEKGTRAEEWGEKGQGSVGRPNHGAHGGLLSSYLAASIPYHRHHGHPPAPAA